MNRFRSSSERSSSERIALLLLTLAGALPIQVGFADTLHKVENGAYRHHDSGWIFANTIGDFTLAGAPQDIDGTVDVVAYYARMFKTFRAVATVNVYSSSSAAADATLQNAKSLMELSLKDAAAQPVTDFSVGKEQSLTGKKVLYTTALGADTSHTALYYYDTGSWIVKITATVPGTEQNALRSLDNFVREQQWGSLILAEATCTGPACGTTAAGESADRTARE